MKTVLPAGCYGEAGTYTLLPTGKRPLTAGKGGEDEVGMRVVNERLGRLLCLLFRVNGIASLLWVKVTLSYWSMDFTKGSLACLVVRGLVDYRVSGGKTDTTKRSGSKTEEELLFLIKFVTKYVIVIEYSNFPLSRAFEPSSQLSFKRPPAARFT